MKKAPRINCYFSVTPRKAMVVTDANREAMRLLAARIVDIMLRDAQSDTGSAAPSPVSPIGSQS